MNRLSYLVTFLAPAAMLVLSVPLIRGKVGRNYWYGFRTAYTLSSDAVWYRANRISGLALLGASLAWFLAAALAPQLVSSGESARLGVFLFGLGCIAVAVAVSFWLVYQDRV